MEGEREGSVVPEGPRPSRYHGDSQAAGGRCSASSTIRVKEGGAEPAAPRPCPRTPTRAGAPSS